MKIFNLIQEVYSYMLPFVKLKFYLHVLVTSLIIASDVLTLILIPKLISLLSADNPQAAIEQSISLSVLFLLTYLSSGIFRTMQIVLQAQIANKVAVGTSYNFFKNIHSLDLNSFNELNLGEVSSSLGVKITRAINEVVMPSLVVPANAITVGVLVSYLLIQNPVETIIVFVLIGTCYLGVIYFSNKQITYVRDSLPRLQDQQIKTIFHFIYEQKNVRLNANYTSFEKAFMINETELRNNNALLIILSTIPRYIIETLSILIILTILFISFFSNNLALFGYEFIITLLISAQKILPAVQHTYQNFTVMKASQGFFNEISSIERVDDPKYNVKKQSFHESLSLKEITLHKPSDHGPLIENGELYIPKSKVTLLYGQSGSGKTTFLENLMGLSNDIAGELYVDGERVDISERISFFSGSTYYASQRVSCANLSVIEFLECADITHQIMNIIVKLNLCNEASKHEYLNKEIGENGAFLSGGEFQRLNIVKALISSSSTLILDEPTSAVSPQAELDILNALESSNKTIIIISHSSQLINKIENKYKIHDGKLNKAND